jgi:hypothetical protein
MLVTSASVLDARNRLRIEGEYLEREPEVLATLTRRPVDLITERNARLAERVL